MKILKVLTFLLLNLVSKYEWFDAPNFKLQATKMFQQRQQQQKKTIITDDKISLQHLKTFWVDQNTYNVFRSVKNYDEEGKVKLATQC